MTYRAEKRLQYGQFGTSSMLVNLFREHLVSSLIVKVIGSLCQVCSVRVVNPAGLVFQSIGQEEI